MPVNRDFSVVIPIKLADQTAAGARSSNSSVDAMLKNQLRAIELANNAQVASERRTALEIAQVQAQQSRREVAQLQQDFREIQKIHSDKLNLIAREAAAKKAADDKYSREAMADMRRMAAERARIAQENARAEERAAQQATNAQIREAKRQAAELANSLGAQQGTTTGGGWLQSILGGVAGGAAVGLISASLGILRRGFDEVVSIVPEAASALFGFVKAGAEVEQELKRDSEMVNFSVETLSTLRVAAKSLGIEYETLTRGLGIFDKNLLLAREGHNLYSKAFKENNIDIYDNEKALNQFIDVLAHTTDGAKQTGLAMIAFGRSGRAMAAITKELGGDLDAFKEVLRSTGLLLGGEGANEAHEFHKQLVLLDLQSEALHIRLAHDLMPTFISLIALARSFVVSVGPMITRFLIDQQAYWTNVGHGVGFFSDKLKDIGSAAKPASAGLLMVNGAAVQQADVLDKVGIAAKESTNSIVWGFTRAVQPLLLLYDIGKKTLDIFERIGSFTRTPALAGVQVDKSKFDPSQSLANLLRIGKGTNTSEQIEAATGIVEKLRDAVEKTRREVETFGHTSALDKFNDSVKEMKLQNLPGYLVAEENGYLAAGAAQARRLDQLEAQKKAQEKALQEQKRAQEEVTATGNTLDQQLAEMTERHRQLNAELGKSPDALKDYDTWLSRLSPKTKDLIDRTPDLTSKLQALREEAKAFSADQAQTGYATILQKINEEAGRYTNTGKEAKTASENLRAEFVASGLAARITTDQVAALNKALDDLAKQERKVAAQRQQEVRESTAKAVTTWRLQIDRMKSGKEETELDRIVNGLINIKELKIPETALDPISNALERMQKGEASTGDTLYYVRQALDAYMQSARGSTVATGDYDEFVKRVTSSLVDAAEATSAMGRAQARQRNEQKNLRDELEASQQEVALVTESSALRQQIAYQKAYNEIKIADQSALESQIASQAKLSDATVLHSQQVRATVLDHLASQVTITQAFGNGIVSVYDKVTGVIDRSIDKLTHGLSIVDDVLKSIAHQLVNRLFQRFLDAFFPASGAAAQGGGSASGGGFGGILRGIFGGGGAANTPPFAGSFASGGSSQGLLGTALGALIPGLGGGGVTSPPSLTGNGGAGLASIISRGLGIGIGGAPIAGGGGLFGGLAASLGPMLPLLGLTAGVGLGAGLGAPSRFGGILGAVGGGLAGLGLGAAVFFALGGTTVGGTLGATLLPLLANPFTIAIGAALLIGAILLARNAQRRKDETTRATLSTDVYTATIQILNDTRVGKYTKSQALTAFDKVGTDYLTQVSQIKDKKTRQHATDWWFNDFRPVYRPLIEKAGEDSDLASNRRARMSPVFASGGYNSATQLIKVRPTEGIRFPNSTAVHQIPGKDYGYDSQYMYAPKGTQVIPVNEMRNAPRMASGGMVGGWDKSISPKIEASVTIDENGLADIVLSSPLFNDAVVRGVKVGRIKRRL